jgi:hypothetical protein
MTQRITYPEDSVPALAAPAPALLEAALEEALEAVETGRVTVSTVGEVAAELVVATTDDLGAEETARTDEAAEDGAAAELGRAEVTALETAGKVATGGDELVTRPNLSSKDQVWVSAVVRTAETAGAEDATRAEVAVLAPLEAVSAEMPMLEMSTFTHTLGTESSGSGSTLPRLSLQLIDLLRGESLLQGLDWRIPFQWCGEIVRPLLQIEMCSERSCSGTMELLIDRVHRDGVEWRSFW